MPDFCSQLDTQETTDLQHDCTSFREWCLRDHREEYEATKLAISHRDDLLGQDHVHNLRTCRTRAWFSVNIQDRHLRIATNNCRERWCPICARGLAKFREASVGNWIRETGDCKFLTLTLRHSDDPLMTQIKDLYYYFRQFRKTIAFKYHVQGGIWFFQIKRSKKTGGWHPHLHCVIDSCWWSKVDISNAWRLITAGSYIIDIRIIRDEIKTAEYVARYSSRPCQLKSLTLPDRLDVIESLFRRRLCGTWGTAKVCPLTNKMTINKEDWRNVGTFKTVMQSKSYHFFSKIIFDCWRRDTALPKGIDVSLFDKPAHLVTAMDTDEFEYLSYFEAKDH